MQTQDVLSRLRRATTDRVPTARRSSSGTAGGRLVLGEFCHNCGKDSLSTVVSRRHLVPGEPANDGNRVSLCDDCHDHAPTAEHVAADVSGCSPARWGGLDATYEQCLNLSTTIDERVVRDRNDHRCRGCGVRERIVVGDDLHLHPVVPTTGAGYRHAHNYVCLCPSCHCRLHD